MPSHCAENLKLSSNLRARLKREERKEQRRGSHSVTLRNEQGRFATLRRGGHDIEIEGDRETDGISRDG